MGIDRKHVLIACAIAGAVLGVVLAVLQAVGPFATSDLHGMPTGASRSTGFMLAMAPLLAAWGGSPSTFAARTRRSRAI